jgi:hypothetical protein
LSEVIAIMLPGDESNDRNTRPRDAAIAPCRFAGSIESIRAAGRSLLRFQTNWGRTVVMAIVFAAGVIGLARLSVHVARQAEKQDTADRPDAGIIVRTEVLSLWLPQTLIERAKHQSLQQFLKLPDQDDMWYAVTMRLHQVNGHFEDTTFIRRPCDDPNHMEELLQILATVAGNPPRSPVVDFREASVHCIPRELLKREPRKLMAELLGNPSPTVDLEHAL